jgi:hypothetical protein
MHKTAARQDCSGVCAGSMLAAGPALRMSLWEELVKTEVFETLI